MSATPLGRPALRIVLAEDEVMLRDALAQLLDLRPEVEVVATAADGEEALAAVLEHEPDLLLTDIEMPRMGGLELAAAVHEADVSTRVVVVTTFARAGYVRRAMDAHVAGYVLKAAPIDDLVAALTTVGAGGRVVDPELAMLAWDAEVELTDSERAVLAEAAKGHPNAEIATTLHLAEGTVRNYLSSAIGKLGARNRAEAAAKAQELGLL